MATILHPSVIATFQDFLQGRDLSTAPPEIHWQNFRNQYYVENWDIEYEDFLQFLTEVFTKKRCSWCGISHFPYFIEGDLTCVKCATNTTT